MDSHHTFCDIFKVQGHWPPDCITCKSHTQKIPANLTRTILLRAHQWNSQYQGNEKILGLRHFEDWLMDEQYCRYTWPQFLRFISFQRRFIRGRYQIFQIISHSSFAFCINLYVENLFEFCKRGVVSRRVNWMTNRFGFDFTFWAPPTATLSYEFARPTCHHCSRFKFVQNFQSDCICVCICIFIFFIFISWAF